VLRTAAVSQSQTFAAVGNLPQQVELLEDLMLSICRKSVHLAVKLVWWVRGYLEDLSAISELDVNSDAPGKKVTNMFKHLNKLAYVYLYERYCVRMYRKQWCYEGIAFRKSGCRLQKCNKVLVHPVQCAPC
jgi:hypothetical protein